jgi:hypothetical protein
MSSIFSPIWLTEEFYPPRLTYVGDKWTKRDYSPGSRDTSSLGPTGATSYAPAGPGGKNPASGADDREQGETLSAPAIPFTYVSDAAPMQA